MTIEHIAKSHIRKEAVVHRVLERRGDHPGLVHVISAMEACDAYKPWHDTTSAPRPASLTLTGGVDFDCEKRPWARNDVLSHQALSSGSALPHRDRGPNVCT
jgi:hypothetical protein